MWKIASLANLYFSHNSQNLAQNRRIYFTSSLRDLRMQVVAIHSRCHCERMSECEFSWQSIKILRIKCEISQNLTKTKRQILRIAESKILQIFNY
ncbi:hypothetical protein ACWIUD_03030 [Helicobacter sp. 23-1044]